MDLAFSPEYEAFRSDIAGLLEANAYKAHRVLIAD